MLYFYIVSNEKLLLAHLGPFRPKGGDSDEKVRNYVHHPPKH
jgi:hypothetical protein